MYTHPIKSISTLLLLAAALLPGCRKDKVKTVVVPGAATLASIYYDGELFTGHEVSFTSRTTGNPTYLWDFGDGTTSTLPAPLHTYNDTGNFTVSLVLNKNTLLSKQATIRIERSAKYINLVTGNRVWRHTHGTSHMGTTTTVSDPDTSFEIKYVDPAHISIGAYELAYRMDLDYGTMEAFQTYKMNDDGNVTSWTLYFRHGAIDSFTYSIQTNLPGHRSAFDYFYAP